MKTIVRVKWQKIEWNSEEELLLKFLKSLARFSLIFLHEEFLLIVQYALCTQIVKWS
jgi:hypothetical protein